MDAAIAWLINGIFRPLESWLRRIASPKVLSLCSWGRFSAVISGCRHEIAERQGDGRVQKKHTGKGMLSYCQGLIQLSVSIDANIGEEFHRYCSGRETSFFASVFTFSLFLYEIRGMLRSGGLIRRGKRDRRAFARAWAVLSM